MKKCGVYLIVSPTNRRYVGSSNNIKKRWQKYKGILCEQQPSLYASFRKYGVNNHKFKILYECEPEERLAWERIFGDLYLSLSDFGGLNHELPNYNEIPKVFSQERLARISVFSKEVNNRPEIRKIHSDTAKRTMSSPEMRKKSSDRLKKKFEDPKQRKIQSERARIQMNNPINRELNRQRAIERMSNPLNREHASRKTKEFFKNNPDAAKKNSERMKIIFSNPEKWHLAKKVINTETGEIFLSAKMAAKSFGMQYDNFKNRLNGGVTKVTPIPFKYL